MSANKHRKRIDVLLATGSSGGTISAVRELSKKGLAVGLISSELFSPASWSRHTSISFGGPQERKSQRFLDLLLRIGKASPGLVLIATSDETAWLYTRNAVQLSQYFRLHQPAVETMERILDKKLLSDAAIKAGLSVLPTWTPRNLGELIAAAPSLPYPVLIKPRTQVRRLRNDKGVVATSPIELILKFRTYLALEQLEEGSHLLPHVTVPMLQQFVPIGSEGVYSVSGYVDQSGDLFVTRHTTKVFQRSQPAGVGVCFESLPANSELSAAVFRLCRELGYSGIFEVEFIRLNGRWAVIDFNPRLFNQAGMDAHRGMPLALFAYLEAAGKTSELRDAIAAAQAMEDSAPAVFYDRFTLRAILLVKFLTRRSTPEEYRHWHGWMKRNAAHSVDFAAEKSDRLPGVVHAVSETVLGLRALRRFVRSSPRTAATPQPVALGVHQ